MPGWVIRPATRTSPSPHATPWHAAPARSVRQFSLGRWPCIHGRRHAAFGPQVHKDSGDHAGLGDRGNPSASRSTLGTLQNIHRKHPGHQLRPGAAAAGAAWGKRERPGVPRPRPFACPARRSEATPLARESGRGGFTFSRSPTTVHAQKPTLSASTTVVTPPASMPPMA